MTYATVETIAVVINGTPRQVPRDATLLGVLAALGLDPRLVVVEHNRSIVRRPALGDVRVAPGDAIELVHFVGGG
jgi:thiamine biosynthesis protein ThiS